MIYEQICHFSSRIPPFNILGGRRKNREIAQAVEFLSPIMQITQKGVFSAAYLVAFLAMITAVLILSLMEIHLLIIIPLMILSSIIAYYIIISYPVSIMNSYKLSLSEEADLVFEQFILVFQAGGTIFDAIEMVASSNHPYLSKAFQRMLSRINEGVPPEVCLVEFAKSQPSDDLRRYFTGIVSSLEEKTNLLEMLSGESFEADLTLRQMNLELESRLLIVAALSTYIPILFVLAVALAGLATNPIVLLAVPLFLGLISFLKSRFSTRFASYFDRPRESGITTPTQSQIVVEYDEFLNFLILLGERLRLGDTLEVALPSIRDEIGPEIQRLADVALESVYWKSESIDEAMHEAANKALGQRVSNLMLMIPAMCNISAVDAGDRLSRIAARLVKRSAVAKERDAIIRAQRLKIYLLNLTSSIVLGLLGSLSPFLHIAALFSGGPLWSLSIATIYEILPLAVSLFIVTTINGYQNTRMVGGSRAIAVGMINGLLFWISFLFSSIIMGVNLSWQ